MGDPAAPVPAALGAAGAVDAVEAVRMERRLGLLLRPGHAPAPLLLLEVLWLLVQRPPLRRQGGSRLRRRVVVYPRLIVVDLHVDVLVAHLPWRREVGEQRSLWRLHNFSRPHPPGRGAAHN